MTRTLIHHAIRCGRFVQGETLPIERFVIVPGCVFVLMLIIGGAL